MDPAPRLVVAEGVLELFPFSLGEPRKNHVVLEAVTPIERSWRSRPCGQRRLKPRKEMRKPVPGILKRSGRGGDVPRGRQRIPQFIIEKIDERLLVEGRVGCVFNPTGERLVAPHISILLVPAIGQLRLLAILLANEALQDEHLIGGSRNFSFERWRF